MDRLLNEVTSTPYYKDYIEIERKMKCNKEIMLLIDEIKLLQRKLVKNYSKDMDDLYNEKVLKLNDYPIYKTFIEKQALINQDLQYIRKEIQDFFDKITLSS